MEMVIGMSRSIRVARKVHIRTDRAAGKSGGSTFFKGLLGGLSAATRVYDVEPRSARSYSGAGLRGDWRAVGDDMRAAMRKVNGE
jgi:hypothetical protein